MTQKNPASLIDPKKKTFSQNFRPQKITLTPPPPPSLKYVSGAPGNRVVDSCLAQAFGWIWNLLDSNSQDVVDQQIHG